MYPVSRAHSSPKTGRSQHMDGIFGTHNVDSRITTRGRPRSVADGSPPDRPSPAAPPIRTDDLGCERFDLTDPRMKGDACVDVTLRHIRRPVRG
jgi:hypothetical protein